MVFTYSKTLWDRKKKVPNFKPLDFFFPSVEFMHRYELWHTIAQTHLQVTLTRTLFHFPDLNKVKAPFITSSSKYKRNQFVATNTAHEAWFRRRSHALFDLLSTPQPTSLTFTSTLPDLTRLWRKDTKYWGKSNGRRGNLDMMLKPQVQSRHPKTWCWKDMKSWIYIQ